MTDAPQPEFDPATWTPDKPWPKGYYKPVPGLIAAIARADAAAGASGGDSPGFRRFLWGLVVLPLQGVGLYAAFGSQLKHGLLHAAAQAMTPVPLCLLFTLVLPTLLYMGIVSPPGARPGRSAGYGLVASLASLAVILLAILARPLLGAFFRWLAWMLA